MLEGGLEHPPAHLVAEVDHARGEAFAGLREGLHEAAGDLEFAGDEVDGDFVAEVAELEGGVEAAVYAGGFDLRWRAFGEGFRAVRPVGCHVRMGHWSRVADDALHSVDQAWIDAYKFENSQAAFIQAFHFSAEDWPIDVCLGAVKRGEGVENVHLSVHDEGPERPAEFAM